MDENKQTSEKAGGVPIVEQEGKPVIKPAAKPINKPVGNQCIQGCILKHTSINWTKTAACNFILQNYFILS